MEKLLDTISFRYSDPQIIGLLNEITSEPSGYSYNFNQNEDSFIKNNTDFSVPAIAIHHDVSKQKPSDEYLDTLRTLFANLFRIFPDVFAGTRYFFDAAEILRPCFIQIFKAEDSYYLYLLRIDLNIRLSDCSINISATNDRTAAYSSQKLFFESLLIPIKKPDLTTRGGEIPINRLFSSTWTGETGTGYHLNGQWIDREITKLISTVFLPENARTYPYYPFKCDFNTVCFSPPILNPEGRRSFLTYMHKSLPMIIADIRKIETELKTEKFRKDMPLLLELKKKVPAEWTKIWSSLKISPYLNENEMKEYLLEFRLS
ncbi:MAG: hypothetical protein JEZ04_03400 [Spirochaetales bacterium]|nr:hypothetical protein [Spirochaetales bacterium]